MTTLDYVYTGGIILAILSLIGASLFLYRFFLKHRQLKKLPIKKLRNKKKQRRIRRIRQELLAQKRQSIRAFVLSLVLFLSFSAGAIGLSYYQSMTLGTDDSDSLVKGYYLLRDFKKELAEVESKQEDKEKLQKNIRYLGTSMASYGTKKASSVNTEEGQLVLNRYYKALKELGMNVSTQTNNFYENPSLVEEFLTDSAKVETYEKAAFTYYKVDESLLKESK